MAFKVVNSPSCCINSGKFTFHHYFMNNKLITKTFEYLQILTGITLASLGLKAFLLPNGFLDGGVTGIAILVHELTGYRTWWLLLVISIPFLLLAWFHISKRMAGKSLVSIAILAAFMYFENFTPITDDKLLIAIFGGLLLGLGIGLAIRNGSVLDGSEILGIFVSDRYGLSIGNIILAFNIVLFTVTAFIISVEVAMYSVLTYLVTAKVIDFVIKGFEDYVGLMIVLSHSKLIEEQLIQKIGTGVTVYKGSRGYGKKGMQENTEIIHLVINRIDIRKTYNAVERTDPQAFIIEFDVNHIKGGVLRKYLS